MIDKSYVRIKAGQLHLRHVAGAPARTPLVMLHASPASTAALVPLMEALGETRPLYAFDTPGNGQSCAPDMEAPAIADYAAMLNEACDALGLGQIAVYGSHTGSHIAAEWALAKPDRVEGIMLDGVAIIPEEERAEYLARYAPHKVPDEIGSQFHWAWSYMRDQMIFFPHYAKDHAHMRTGGTFDARILHQLVLDILNNLETYHLAYEAVFQHEVEAALAKVSVPTLVVVEGHGALDPAGERVQELVQGSEIVRDCGTPAAKAAAIGAFLERIAS